jgi:hypothetical protein
MECKTLTPDGVFCTRECVEQFRSFQGRIISTGRRRGKISLFAWIGQIVGAVILIIIIYAVLAYWLKTTAPGEMWHKLTGNFRLLF